MAATAMSPLKLDPAAATTAIATAFRAQVGEVLHRRGLVVGMSGGIDSPVCAGLAVRALGAERVFGLSMPERDSDPVSLALARDYGEQLGIEHTTEMITPVLEGAACYRRRNEAIRRLVPEFGDDWNDRSTSPCSGGDAPPRSRRLRVLRGRRREFRACLAEFFRAGRPSVTLPLDRTDVFAVETAPIHGEMVTV